MPADDATIGFDHINRWLSEVQSRMRPDRPPITTFRRELLQVVSNGVRRSLLEGTDIDGSPTARLAPTTSRYRHGTGPPRAPHGTDSRMVRGVDGRWTVGLITNEALLEVRNVCPFASYLEQGTNHMPARPSLGISPETWHEIEALTHRLPAAVLGKVGGF